jgi:osmotically-inducible protein OsmY
MQLATRMANNNGPWNERTDRTRGHEYDHAFDRAPDPGDHVPDPNRDSRWNARAYGSAPDDAGGFGPSTQGPYGQSAYGRVGYTGRYVVGSNHPYADREAHNRYNAEHFPVAGQGPAGPHRGKGPKSFTRSDERLEEHVNELLMEHDEIDATHLEVHVEGGEISVTGTVEDRSQRRAVEDLLEGMFGVKDVHLHVKLAGRRG